MALCAAMVTAVPTLPIFHDVALSAAMAATPEKSGYINVSGGAKIYYEERGSGEPLILLHGHSLDTRMWDPQFKTFAKHYRTVRFDFRGYGKSSSQDENIQFTHLEDLLTLMDSLRIPRAHIVGLSMGAFVASDMLALKPERMISCVLASGGMKTYKGPSEPMDSAEKAKRDREIAALKAKGVDKMKEEWLNNLVNSGGSHREKIREPLRKMISDWTAWQPLHYEPRVIWAADAAKVFKSKMTSVPTLIIDGDPSERIKGHKPWMLEYLSDAQYIVIPDCGHMLNMERPGKFNKTVLNFLKSVWY